MLDWTPLSFILHVWTVLNFFRFLRILINKGNLRLILIIGAVFNRMRNPVSFIGNIHQFFVELMLFFNLFESAVLNFVKLILFEFVSIVV